MREQTYARYALPAVLILLVASVLAVLVPGGFSSADRKGPAAQKLTTRTPTPSHNTIAVRTADNPSTIARRAGIPLDRLLELNPRIDPRALHVGDSLKLVA